MRVITLPVLQGGSDNHATSRRVGYGGPYVVATVLVGMLGGSLSLSRPNLTLLLPADRYWQQKFRVRPVCGCRAAHSAPSKCSSCVSRPIETQRARCAALRLSPIPLRVPESGGAVKSSWSESSAMRCAQLLPPRCPPAAASASCRSCCQCSLSSECVHPPATRAANDLAATSPPPSARMAQPATARVTPAQ